MICAFVASCASAVAVNAAQCGHGELMLEYAADQAAEDGFYTARLMGQLDMPTPNYAYKFTYDEAAPQNSAQLSFLVANPDMMSMQVITPITIDETLHIPHNSTSLMIDVIKDFGWGAEYFQAKYPDGFENHKAICMKPEMYK